MKAVVEPYTSQLMGKGGGKALQALTEAGKAAKYARVQRMFDQTRCRVEWNVVVGTPECKLVEEVLEKLWEKESTEMEGVAPPGDLARNIQEADEEMGPEGADRYKRERDAMMAS